MHTQNQKFSWLVYLLKNFNSDPVCTCNHAHSDPYMQTSTHAKMHAAIHARENTCSHQCTWPWMQICIQAHVWLCGWKCMWIKLLISNPCDFSMLTRHTHVSCCCCWSSLVFPRSAFLGHTTSHDHYPRREYSYFNTVLFWVIHMITYLYTYPSK